VRAKRQALELTQEQLAEAAGISARVIGEIERGADKRPYRSTLERLADALELSQEDRDQLLASLPPLPSRLEANAQQREISSRRTTRPLIYAAAAAALITATIVVIAVAIGVGQTETVDPAAVSNTVYVGERVYLESLACACDAGLTRAFVDPQLRIDRATVADLRRNHEREETASSRVTVSSVSPLSASSADVAASSIWRWRLWKRGKLRELCTADHTVSYVVDRVRQGWRISAGTELGTTQCVAADKGSFPPAPHRSPLGTPPVGG